MAGFLSGCGSGKAADATHAIAMADTNTMPAPIRAAPRTVRDAYRFAAANPDTLKQIPCYCGCGAMGHSSNYNCFWQAEDVPDSHALGCGVCVDIAQDVMRGLQQGHTLAVIRQQVDADYSRFGPPTDTPPVAAVQP